jgi:signal transduction histidine kinase
VNFTTAQGLSMNRINIVVEGPDRTFYIGTDAGDINIYKDGEIKKINIKTTLNKAGVRDILPEPNGDLWIASYEGILKITGGKEKLLTTAEGMPANDMRRVLRDKHGNLWFACRTAGVVKYENGKIIASYNKTNGLSSNYILSMEEDANGNLYIGTHSGGMTVIRPDGTTKTFHVSENDAGVLIFNIHLEKNGTAWLVCNTGPHYFDGEKIKKIDLKGLQMGETYFDWLEDTNGNAWVTTNVGVLKIDYEQIKKYKQGTITSLQTKLYDNDDGMKSKECTGATRSTVSSAGKLWIPTLGGISVFYPEKLRDNKIIPPVYVTSIRTDGAVYALDKTEVQPGNLRYIFNYTALSYLAPAKIQFKYKLEGIDPDWQDAKTKREAEYTYLPPGKYTFRVIGSNNDGVWNEQGATMEITVLPFFYQTYWFYAVTAFTVLLIFYLTYKWRISRVEKRNAELRKLNSELDSFVYSTSHDLRAPLASVLGLINLSRLEDRNKEHYINLIEKSVKKLDRFINEIIDYSRNARLDVNATPINFKKIIDEIFEDLEYLEEKNHITTNVEIIEGVPLNSDETRIAIILRNLISNAIKYYNPANANPYLKIHVSSDENYGTILVMDNGIGIEPTRQKDIFKMFYRGSDKSSGSGLGLYIVKESVEKLGGRISVQSKIGEGSTFKVVLPSLTPTN